MAYIRTASVQLRVKEPYNCETELKQAQSQNTFKRRLKVYFLYKIPFCPQL